MLFFYFVAFLIVDVYFGCLFCMLICETDMIFVKKFTPTDFQAKNLHPKFHQI